MLADSALRLATAYAPDSARFWVGLGRFYLNSNVSTMRFAAQGFMDKGLQAARRVQDRPALADAADEKGMVHWRRYETVGRRRMLRPGFPPTDLAEYASRDPRDIEQLVNEFTQVLDPPLGENDFETALAFFNEAAAADPNHRNALRHIFMALADRGNWTELRSAAARRLRASPWDPQAWLATGLAAHRLNDDQAASAAFDSALVFLTAEDRDRYTRISRILRPRPADPKSTLIGDSSRYAGLSDEQRGAVDKLYWMLTDPLSLTPQNEHRLEFLSRVTYAELRWTSDDLDLRGADTDRGDIHIRYGPPPVLLSLAGGGP
jgi:GWxTD domain-containing protein